MSFIRILAFAAALCCLWAACFGQPSSIEPILPPIPDPPYEHTVRFCGIANNENFNLNSTDVSSKCDWKRYAIVRPGQGYLKVNRARNDKPRPAPHLQLTV
jgi:hypothetical protein